MQSRNPYATPQSSLSGGDELAEDYGEVKILSASGRLGRVRYIGYSAGISLLAMLGIGVLTAIAALVDPTLAIAAIFVGYLAMLALQILLTIQRAHDMNVSGWLSLIVFVPLGVFVFWCVPGTQGENKYGKPPPPNTTGVILLACILPLVAVVGILAAIAVPAYQDYTVRAQVSEGFNLAAGARAAVEDAYRRTRSAPADRADAGMSAAPTDTAGLYVEGVEIYRGTVFVVYGQGAHATISGRALALQPYVLGGDEIVWRCAAGPTPAGAVVMDAGAPSSASETDIDSRHLPSRCRP